MFREESKFIKLGDLVGGGGGGICGRLENIFFHDHWILVVFAQ
jgi:hypothetical protein